MDLELKNIRKSYGEGDSKQEVLRGISFELKAGDICVLLGPSGSGKSTLLNIIGGIDTADSGSVTIGDHTIERMTEKDLSQYRRDHLGFVFQSYNLIPNLTVKENIEVGAYLSDDPLPLDELIRTLGLWEHKDKTPNQTPEDSSSGLPSAEPLSRTRTYSSAMNRRVLWITTRQKKFSTSLRRSTTNMGAPLFW